MKKIFSLFMLLYLLFFIPNVYASSFKVSIVGDDTFEDEIVLNVQVNNFKDFEDTTCKGLCGFVGKIDYDDTKIELISIKALQDFELVEGEKVVLYKATGVSNNSKILEMKFKNKTLVKGDSVSISLTDMVGSDGDNDIETDIVVKTIKYATYEEEIKTGDTTEKEEETNTTSLVPSTPTTGDNIMTYVIIFVVSMIVLVGTIIAFRKKKQIDE